MSDAAPITRTIQVYGESPVWDRYARWFQIPLDQLNALWVAGYSITGDVHTADVEHMAAEVRTLHPGCVLVY